MPPPELSPLSPYQARLLVPISLWSVTKLAPCSHILLPQVAIKSLIEARFDAVSTDAAQTIPTPPPGPATEPSSKHEANGYAQSDEDASAAGEIEVSIQPAKKKQKRESSSEDADARLAAELQAQENRLSRGPRTRGGSTAKATKKAKPKAKAPKKKSEKRVRSDDDSGVEDSEAAVAKKRKASGGFQKPFNLSFPLAEICGENQVCVAEVQDFIRGLPLTRFITAISASGG